MTTMPKSELESLVHIRGSHCVSIYMPNGLVADGAAQNPIRLKNLLARAQDLLMSRGMRRSEADELLSPAWALVAEAGRFWDSSEGVALFVTSGFFRHYRLPLRFDELVIASEHMHVKPLLPLFMNDGRYYVLALSQDNIRLMQCTKHSVRDVALEGVTTRYADYLCVYDMKDQLQVRSTGPVAQGRRSAIYSTQGAVVDDSSAKRELTDFLAHVDAGVRKALGSEKTPLVLAGVDYLCGIYRQVNSYGFLAPGCLGGNPDRLRPMELHDRAWEVVQPRFAQAQEQMLAQYRRFAGTGRASDDVGDIILAASMGRVGTLLVGDGHHAWGTVAPDGRVELHRTRHDGDEDLLDLAVVRTLAQGGTVFAIGREEVPVDRPAAALMRYVVPIPQAVST